MLLVALLPCFELSVKQQHAHTRHVRAHGQASNHELHTLGVHLLRACWATVTCITNQPSLALTPVLSCPPLTVPASLAVDLYPLALHVSLCDAAGRPGGRERLVLTSHHVHVRDMLLEASDSSSLHGLSRALSLNAAASMPEEVSVDLYLCGYDMRYVSGFQLEVYKQSLRRSPDGIGQGASHTCIFVSPSDYLLVKTKNPGT